PAPSRDPASSEPSRAAPSRRRCPSSPCRAPRACASPLCRPCLCGVAQSLEAPLTLEALQSLGLELVDTLPAQSELLGDRIAGLLDSIREPVTHLDHLALGLRQLAQ